MTRYHNQKGQTLVELLLALGLFAFIMTAVFALVFGGLTTGLRTEEQDYATMYAQEGLDAARSIRDTDWNAFAQNGTHGVDNAGAGWSWSGTNNETPFGARKFTREIAVEDVYRDANNNIFTGSNSVDFDYADNTDYQCEGGTCPSTNIIFDAVAGTTKLNGGVRLDNAVNPKELIGTETNLKALYHFNATSGAEANKEGKELAIGDLGPDPNLDTDLKGLWHLNENIGSTTVDTSGNSNTGYLDKFPQNGNLGTQVNMGIAPTPGASALVYGRPTIIRNTDNTYRIYYSFSNGTNWSIRYRDTTDTNLPDKITGGNISPTEITLLGVSGTNYYSPWIERKPDNTYRVYFGTAGTYWSLAYRDTTDTNLPSNTNLSGTQVAMGIGGASGNQAQQMIIKRKPDNTYRIHYNYIASYSVIAYRDTTDTNLPDKITGGNISGTQTLIGIGNNTSTNRAEPNDIIQLEPGYYRLYYRYYNGTYWQLAYVNTINTNLPQSGNITSQLLLGVGSASTQALDARVIDKGDGTYRLYYSNYQNSTTLNWHLVYQDTNKIQPAWTTAGKFSNALSFDGVDDYVDTGNAINPSGATGYTIEAWIKSSAGAVADAIAGWYDGTNGIFMQSKVASGEGITVVAGGGTAYGEVNVDTHTNWVHAALVYDGTLSGNTNKLKLYVNGAQQTLAFGAGTVPASMPALTSSNFKIGDVGALNRKWAGSIDEVAVYNTALSAPQITDHYRRGVAEDATIIETTGNTFGANDGNIYSATTTTGNTNLHEALQFDGVDDYVSVGNVGTGIKSVEFWINNTDGDTPDGILELVDNTSYVSIASGAITATGFTAPTVYVDGSSASAVLGSGWHHIAVTTNTAINAASVKIGEANNNYFSGNLDEVAIWNKVLTQADIWDHIGANVGYAVNSNATVKYNPNPPSTPNKDTLYIDKFKEFVETATIPAGTSIDYQLSTDDCTTMKYWDGDSWENAGGWNDVRTINRYFDQFKPLSSTICLSARLNTTDANQTPVLDNVEIKYSQSKDDAITWPADTHTKKVTSRVKWPSGFSFQDVSLTEYLTDWMYPEFITDTETDFLEYNTLSTTNIKINTNGSIELQDPLVAGQYERREKDAGAQNQFLKVSWETVLSGGSATITVETAPDNSGLPDSWTASSFSLTDGNGSGSDPLFHLNTHQWVRFRVNIVPNSPSPKINKITIQAKNLY